MLDAIAHGGDREPLSLWWSKATGSWSRSSLVGGDACEVHFRRLGVKSLGPLSQPDRALVEHDLDAVGQLWWDCGGKYRTSIIEARREVIGPALLGGNTFAPPRHIFYVGAFLAHTQPPELLCMRAVNSDCSESHPISGENGLTRPDWRSRGLFSILAQYVDGHYADSSESQLIGHRAAIAFHEPHNAAAFKTSQRRGFMRDDAAAHQVQVKAHALWPDRPHEVRADRAADRPPAWVAWTRPARPWTTQPGKWALTLPAAR